MDSPQPAESGTAMHESESTLANGHRHIAYPVCSAVMAAAESEFVAFTRAVTELFGPEQAGLSADDWLNEVASRDGLPCTTTREWRLVTVAASARLTIRMAAAHDSSDAASNL